MHQYEHKAIEKKNNKKSTRAMQIMCKIGIKPYTLTQEPNCKKYSKGTEWWHDRETHNANYNACTYVRKRDDE